jgi:hypothetical protein
MKEFISKQLQGPASTFFTGDQKTGGDSPFFQMKAENEETSLTEEQTCNGWESDPQSFCIKVAKHFLASEYSMTSAVESVTDIEESGCHVNFENGVVITVQQLGAQEVWVSLSPSSSNSKLATKICRYSYRCFTNGKLELTRIRCTGK